MTQTCLPAPDQEENDHLTYITCDHQPNGDGGHQLHVKAQDHVPVTMLQSRAHTDLQTKSHPSAETKDLWRNAAQDLQAALEDQHYHYQDRSYTTAHVMQHQLHLQELTTEVRAHAADIRTRIQKQLGQGPAPPDSG